MTPGKPAAPRYKLVPVEPTLEMREAGGTEFLAARGRTSTVEQQDAAMIYRAMLAAAPPAAGDEGAGELRVPFVEPRAISELINRCQRRLAGFRGSDAENWLVGVHIAALSAKDAAALSASSPAQQAGEGDGE